MSPIIPSISYDHRFEQMKKKRRRLVVVSKTRFVLATLTLLIVLSILISALSGTLMSEASTDISFIEYTVEKGDTLWNIAEHYNYRDLDVREVVFDIKSHNELASSQIRPGDVIEIPVSSRADL